MISLAIAIMGRSAAYSGALLTDKQIMSSTDLLIDTKGLNFETPFTPRESPVPGKTKFI